MELYSLEDIRCILGTLYIINIMVYNVRDDFDFLIISLIKNVIWRGKKADKDNFNRLSVVYNLKRISNFVKTNKILVRV